MLRSTLTFLLPFFLLTTTLAAPRPSFLPPFRTPFDPYDHTVAPPSSSDSALANTLISSAESLITHHNDYRTAIRHLRLASILSHPGAATTIAALLLSPHPNLPRNLPAAVVSLRRAVRAGQPDALALLGLLHASGLADRYGVEKSIPKALVHWTLAAGSGNVFANSALGFRYMHGISVARNCQTAATYYKRAAHAIATDPRYWPTPHNFQFGEVPLASSLVSVGRTRLSEDMFDPNPPANPEDLDVYYYHTHRANTGDADSMALLGSLLLTGGLGMHPDHNQARQYLHRAAHAGNGEAHGIMGHLELRKGNHTGALTHFRYSAAHQDRIGHYALGMIFLHGLAGMDKDLSKAAMHFELAAEHKHAQASFQLGMMYYRGEGRDKNVDEAFKHFENAANLGNVQSKLNIAMILFDGLKPAEGKNCPKALKLFKEVAEEGEWNTLFDLALTAFDKKDLFGSLYRHAQAAHAGIELGQYNAAMILEMAKEGDLRELAHWDRQRMIREMRELYDMSGRQGNSKSHIRAGDVSYLEDGDYLSALESYNSSALQNNPEGIFSVGMMYANGQGVAPDREKAVGLLFTAGEKDSGSAIAANLAVAGLRVYWWLLDSWAWWTKLNESVEPDVPQGSHPDSEPSRQNTQSGTDNAGRISTSSKQVKARTPAGDDLALVGGLLFILIAVLVVRTKRIARQSAEGEATTT